MGNEAHLSEQAMKAVMLCLQISLAKQEDIRPMLESLSFVWTEDGLAVTNPPTYEVDFAEEENAIVSVEM